MGHGDITCMRMSRSEHRYPKQCTRGQNISIIKNIHKNCLSRSFRGSIFSDVSYPRNTRQDQLSLTQLTIFLVKTVYLKNPITSQNDKNKVSFTELKDKLLSKIRLISLLQNCMRKQSLCHFEDQIVFVTRRLSLRIQVILGSLSTASYQLVRDWTRSAYEWFFADKPGLVPFSHEYSDTFSP